VLAAADPDGFAAAIARLYTDTELWHRLRSHALARVAEDCSPALFAERVEAALRF
jgi:glycosyltransferase involved in cell wall biosynthesis